MESNLDEMVNTEQVVFTNGIKKYMSQIRKWSLFLAIVGTIFTTIVLVGLFFALFMMGDLIPNNGSSALQTGIQPGLLLAIYMPMLLLYIIPINYAFRLAKHIKEALSTDNQYSYEQCMRYMKNLFAFFGWTTLIVLGLYVISLIVASLVAVLA